jgi:hypothetical protein
LGAGVVVDMAVVAEVKLELAILLNDLRSSIYRRIYDEKIYYLLAVEKS